MEKPTIGAPADEKAVTDVEFSEVKPEPPSPTSPSSRTLGELAFAGEDALPAPPVLTAEEEARLWRKIDLRIVPIVSAMYLCSFLDRSNIGNAKLQGLVTQLDLTGQRFNVALTMWFMAFNFCTIPASTVVKKLRPSKYLPSITVTWGVVMTLMGFVKTYAQLVGVRVALGIAESGLVGVLFYLSLWYPRNMLQTRMALFWGGATFAGAFSGLLAFGISFMGGTAGLEGWSWIFIIEGLFTVLVGIIAFFVLVDLPDDAKFLTPEERAFVIHRKKYDNSSVGEEERFAIRHVWDALLDWQVWMLSIIDMSVFAPLYGISLFLPSIINGFGFNTTISQLLTIPPYVVATVTVIVWGIWSDRIHLRSPFLFCGQMLCLIGFAINLGSSNIGAKYFGTFLIVSGGYATYPAAVAWISNNTAGQYKRAVAIPFQVIFGNFGAAIASNVYRIQDAPRYALGHGIELAIVSVGILLMPVALIGYWRMNKRKEATLREAEERGVKYSTQELRRLGDRAPDFKYTL